MEPYLFTSDIAGNLLQWSIYLNQFDKNPKSISLHCLTNYEKSTKEKGNIEQIKISPNNEYLLSCGGIINNKSHKNQPGSDPRKGELIAPKTISTKGFVNQYSLKTKSLIKKYEFNEIHNIKAMVCTNDSKYLFVGTLNGDLYQISILTNQIIEIYKKIHTRWLIGLTSTYDNRYLFTFDYKGVLKQWSLSSVISPGSKQLLSIRDYGKVHPTMILSLAITSDSQYLYTADGNGILMQWSIQKKRLQKNFGQISRMPIHTIKICKAGRWLYLYDMLGLIRILNLKSSKILKAKTFAGKNAKTLCLL